MRSMFLLGLCVLGCGGKDSEPVAERRSHEPGDRLIDKVRPLAPAGSGDAIGSCTVQDVELIYVVDAANHLLSFDPQKLGKSDPFKLVGTLDCHTGAHPFSMAIDRGGVAWIVYSNGELFRASILDARCRAPTRLAGDDPPRTYGMAFATDGANTSAETLYIVSGFGSFGKVDITQSPPMWTRIGTVESSPELTGTGDGALFGYFPETTPPFVQQIDPKTGAMLGARSSVPADGFVDAWAVAHSGGMIYEFVTLDGNSTVHSIRRKTGEHAVVLEHLPYRIVGAGVSTCAPELERQP